MSLKKKLAKIKNNIKENPNTYALIAFGITAGTVGAVAAAISIKKELESGNGIHVLLVDDERMRAAKEEGRPIVFKFIEGQWYFKNQDPND